MADNFPQYPATSFDQAVDLTIFSSNQLGDVINGDAISVVNTESGDIPTLRKALVDNFYFKNGIQVKALLFLINYMHTTLMI